MTLSVTTQASPLATKLVQESAADATVLANVTGTSGVLYMLDVDNPNAAAVYLKVFDNVAPDISADPADWVFKVPASTRRSMAIPLGLAFTALSFAVTANAAEGDITDPTSGVLVRLVTS